MQPADTDTLGPEAFERFFMLSRDLLCIAGQDGYFKRVNPAFQVLGYTSEELLARPFFDFVHPDDVPVTLAEVAKLASGARTVEFENRYRCKDGSYRWISWNSTPAASGLIYGVARDVTERHEALAQLERWAHVFEHAAWGIVIGSADGKRLEAMNPEFARMHGYTVEEMRGLTILELFPPSARAGAAEFIRTVNQQGRRYFESEHLRKDGSTFPVSIAANAVKDAAGRVLYRAVHLQDITERRALEAARARLASIVEDSNDAIISRTLDGVITTWNHGAERIFGYAADEIIGQRVSLLFPPAIRDEEGRLTERIRRGERVEHYETQRRRKDGRDIDVGVTLSPLRDAAGELVGISKVARDVSELKLAQRELIVARERAERANRELEAFSYSVAHDLRAPLRGIDGFSQALAEEYGDRLDAEGLRYLGLVRQAAQLMAQLIDDLLKLSRVTRAELTAERVDLSLLAREAVALLARVSPQRAVEVDIADGLVARGDPRLLAIVFDNLLGNAWKFTSKRADARVEVGATERDGERVYFVRDNGAGFDMAYAHKLFGAFQRLHSAKDFEGTGVGLATVQRIITRHGGCVWAEAEPGRGATFYFTLSTTELP